MTSAPYCFFQAIDPRPPLDAEFAQDYLLYAQRGALQVSVGTDTWLLPPSFAAWVPAETPIHVEIAKPVTSCSILVPPGFCPSMPRQPAIFQMSPLTRQMALHCRNWGADTQHPPEAHGFFRALLDVCAGLVPLAVDVRRPATSDPALNRALAYMQAHLATSLTIAQVACAAHLSERSLQRRFAQEMGQSCSEVLTRLRMIEAVALLSEEDRSITQIAGDVGFQSLSAFNRAFLKFADSTPSAFRNSLRS